MEIKAQLNYLRIAPRKVRLIADIIRGMDVGRAEQELAYRLKRASGPLLKLLRSAIANARHNFQLEKEGLYIKSIVVNPGPVSKRLSPRAFGRAAFIKKRTSHVVLELDVREEKAVTWKKAKRVTKKEAPPIREALPGEIKEEVKVRPPEEFKPERVKKVRPADFVRRMFRRKAI